MLKTNIILGLLITGYSSTTYTTLPLWYTMYVKEGLQFLGLASQVVPHAGLKYFGLKQPDVELQREQLKLTVTGGLLGNLATVYNLPSFKNIEAHVPALAGYSLLCRSSKFSNKFGPSNIVF